MKFEIEIDETKIQKAVDKHGKLSNLEIESIVRTLIYDIVKREARKILKSKSINTLVSEALETVDWNAIVKEHIAQLAMYDYD